MPVSLRADGDSIYSTRATLVLANLATHLAHPQARLEAIRASAGNAKSITVKAKSIIPMDFPSLGAPWLLAAVARAYGYAQAVKSFLRSRTWSFPMSPARRRRSTWPARRCSRGGRSRSWSTGWA